VPAEVIMPHSGPLSAISTVVYHKHPDMASLIMKEKMSLDEAFRALHDPHQTYVRVKSPL